MLTNSIMLKSALIALAALVAATASYSQSPQLLPVVLVNDTALVDGKILFYFVVPTAILNGEQYKFARTVRDCRIRFDGYVGPNTIKGQFGEISCESSGQQKPRRIPFTGTLQLTPEKTMVPRCGRYMTPNCGTPFFPKGTYTTVLLEKK